MSPLTTPFQDAAYLTEVHHVNGEGEDAGVVYCEMQARENTAEELSSFLLAHRMYPGHCGYKSNTGGKMSNLRDSCSNEKVSLTSYMMPWTALRSPGVCVMAHGGKLSP